MPNYWIAVACHAHVRKGVEKNFCQVCHGKPGPLNKMTAGDGLIYYSPTEQFQQTEPCRKFTAIGKVTEKPPYLFEMSSDFIPWRREIHFFPCVKVAIEPLIDKLTFIQNKQRWGFPFRRGCFSILPKDFLLIAAAMGVHDKF